MNMNPYNKNPINQMRGAQNRAQGGTFEQIISASCIYYRDCGAAEIEKTPEPFKITRRIGSYKFEGHFEKVAQPDFKGTLIGGKAIVFEAKHTESDRILQNKVTAEQTAALDRHQRMGAACFVLVSLQMKQYAFVPWESWKEMKRLFGHLYMNAKDLERYKVVFNGRIVLFLNGGGAKVYDGAKI